MSLEYNSAQVFLIERLWQYIHISNLSVSRAVLLYERQHKEPATHTIKRPKTPRPESNADRPNLTKIQDRSQIEETTVRGGANSP